MFESCRAHFRVSRARNQARTVRHLDPNETERELSGCTRHSTDLLAVVEKFFTRRNVAFKIEHA